MAGAKEIRNKIGSVKNTQKITGAMEMVAASKMRRAQERMSASRPYAETMRKVIGHIAQGNLEYKHPYLIEREVKRVGYIVVSTDRGLCGGLNINLFKAALNDMKQWSAKGAKVDLALIGNKASNFFERHGAKVKAHVAGLGDSPSVNDLIGSVKVMLKAYDTVRLTSCIWCTTSSSTPWCSNHGSINCCLCPVTEDSKLAKKHHWDYLYEPDPKKLLDTLLVRYVESQVYQGVVENLASEQAARMVAMQAATDNAGNLINDLQLVYNKARQASITQELTEIVSGAAAV